MEISLQRPIIVTFSKDDCTIRIWNYLSGQCMLSRRYFIVAASTQAVDPEHAMQNPQLYQGGGKDSSVKPVLSIALHPSGYYMAAGFIDRVRVMHVLDDELRDFRSLEHRNCSKLKFSNGGQFLVIVEQKFFFVYASYTLEKLAQNKCPSPSVTSIDFNDKDTAFGMVSSDGFIYRFDIMAMKLKGDGNIDRACDFKSCIFVSELGGKENEKLMTVGSENSRALFRVYND